MMTQGIGILKLAVSGGGQLHTNTLGPTEASGIPDGLASEINFIMYLPPKRLFSSSSRFADSIPDKTALSPGGRMMESFRVNE